jgi:hypothetical protein
MAVLVLVMLMPGMLVPLALLWHSRVGAQASALACPAHKPLRLGY